MGKHGDLADQFRQMFLSVELRAVCMFLAALSVVGFFFGGWETYKGVRDGSQLEIACEDYLRERPANHWLKLTFCEFDLEHYVVIERGSTIEKVYFRLRPVADSSGETRIVVMRNDALTLKVVEAWQNDEKPPFLTVEDFKESLQQPIEGMITSGLDDDDKGKIEAPNLNLDLEDGYIVVDQGAAPHLLAGVLTLVGASLCTIAGVVLFLIDRRRRRRRAPAPELGPPPPRLNDPIRVDKTP